MSGNEFEPQFWNTEDNFILAVRKDSKDRNRVRFILKVFTASENKQDVVANRNSAVIQCSNSHAKVLRVKSIVDSATQEKCLYLLFWERFDEPDKENVGSFVLGYVDATLPRFHRRFVFPTQHVPLEPTPKGITCEIIDGPGFAVICTLNEENYLLSTLCSTSNSLSLSATRLPEQFQHLNPSLSKLKILAVVYNSSFAVNHVLICRQTCSQRVDAAAKKNKTSYASIQNVGPAEVLFSRQDFLSSIHADWCPEDVISEIRHPRNDVLRIALDQQQHAEIMNQDPSGSYLLSAFSENQDPFSYLFPPTFQVICDTVIELPPILPSWDNLYGCDDLSCSRWAAATCFQQLLLLENGLLVHCTALPSPVLSMQHSYVDDLSVICILMESSVLQLISTIDFKVIKEYANVSNVILADLLDSGSDQLVVRHKGSSVWKIDTMRPRNDSVQKNLLASLHLRTAEGFNKVKTRSQMLMEKHKLFDAACSQLTSVCLSMAGSHYAKPLQEQKWCPNLKSVFPTANLSFSEHNTHLSGCLEILKVSTSVSMKSWEVSVDVRNTFPCRIVIRSLFAVLNQEIATNSIKSHQILEGGECATIHCSNGDDVTWPSDQFLLRILVEYFPLEAAVAGGSHMHYLQGVASILISPSDPRLVSSISPKLNAQKFTHSLSLLFFCHESVVPDMKEILLHLGNFHITEHLNDDEYVFETSREGVDSFIRVELRQPTQKEKTDQQEIVSTSRRFYCECNLFCDEVDPILHTVLQIKCRLPGRVKIAVNFLAGEVTFLPFFVCCVCVCVCV